MLKILGNSITSTTYSVRDVVLKNPDMIGINYQNKFRALQSRPPYRNVVFIISN